MRVILISTILICFLILNSWKDIIFNINTHLPNWLDELAIIWIYQNNIQHFSFLDFNNLYETNAIYPFKYTLSFAEHMYFPSFLILIISFFTKNIIAQYNVLLVLNHILIYLSALLLFKKLLKNNYASLISAFYITFSPYFFVKIGHFQMLFFWPLLLSLYFLAGYFENKQRKYVVFSSLFAGIQFLSSVYLGIMNLAIILIWFFVNLILRKNEFKKNLRSLAIFIAGFLIVSSVSIYGYLLVNLEYHIKRDYGEYVTYSAHITDYLFPNISQSSALYTSKVFERIKSFNYHMIGEFGVFAGLIPLIFSVYVLFPKLKRIKENIKIDFNFSSLVLFSLLLIIIGFTLSLGPRLFVNGQYTKIPLPYDIILKIFSPIGIIRALARWHFLVIFGFSILLGLGYMKLEEKFAKTDLRKIILFSIILILTFLEFYPQKPFQSVYKNWEVDKSYDFLRSQVCKNENTSLLEYPFHYRNLDGSIVIDVNYMAQILLNSTQLKCKVLSGYYGFEPPEYMKIRDEFANGFDDDDVKIIQNLKIEYIKFNKYAIWDKELMKLEKEKIFDQFTKIYEDQNVVIFRVI